MIMAYAARTTVRIIKALISLPGCAGWSAALLFANLRRHFISRRGPNQIKVYFIKQLELVLPRMVLR